MVNKTKAKVGWTGLIFFSFLPLLFWLDMKSVKVRFSDASSTFTSLGQMSSLIGVSMYSLTLILSGRFSFLEDFFGGMNKIYIAHHILGGLAFVLLLIHPLFLAVTYGLNSLKSAALFLLPGSDWTINLGIISLYSTMILLILTFFIKLPYQIWRFTHKFLGAAFFVGAMHGILMPSDISKNLALRVYMLTIMSAGFLSYVYRTVLTIFIIPGREYTIIQIVKLNEKTVELSLKPMELPLKFRPGQFVFIRFFESRVDRDAHPFSISSSSKSQELKLTIKSLGDFTAEMPYWSVGSRVKVEGPYGRFVSDERAGRDQIWIAGGIGITPFLSMARSFADQSPNIWMYHVIHDLNEALFIDELKEIAQKFPIFKPFVYTTKDSGRITAEIIKNQIGEVAGKEVFLCGPPAMMASLRAQFVELGVPNGYIHSEEFAL